MLCRSWCLCAYNVLMWHLQADMNDINPESLVNKTIKDRALTLQYHPSTKLLWDVKRNHQNLRKAACGPKQNKIWNYH